MSQHPNFLPTGRPVVGHRREWGHRLPDERFGVGVVGLHEGQTLLVALRASQLCRPVAGCDLSEAKRDEAGAHTPGIFLTNDYEQLLRRDDVDIVAIYTPDSLHADQIVAAFKAGKHVVCTKPLVNDSSRSQELVAAAKTHNRRLQVGQSTRFGEPFLRQREHFEQGKLGMIEVVDAHYNHCMDWYYTKSPWTVSTTHWAYLGLSHPVDLVRWYLGEIESVHAIGTTTALGAQHGLTTPDAISVNLRAKSGRIGRVLGNYGFHELPKARSLIECFLMGSEGSSLARYPELKYTYSDANGIEIDEDYRHAMTGYYSRHELLGMHYGEFCNCMDYFASKLLSGEPNSPDLEEGLATVKTMTAIVESLATGQPTVVEK